MRHAERVADLIDGIVSELQAAGWLTGPVGLEMWSYPPNRIVSEQFQAAFEAAGATVVDGTDVVRAARKLKSPQELETKEVAARAGITLPVLSGIKTPTGHSLASRK